MTYYDRLNFFFKVLNSNNIKPSSQLVYLHLLQIQNELRGQLACYVSDRYLSEKTNLSQKTIFDSRQVLKNFGLLDFKVVNGRVKYFFPENLGVIAEFVAEKSKNRPEVASAEGITMPRNNYFKTETENAPARKQTHGNPPKPTTRLTAKTPLELEWEERQKALKSTKIKAEINNVMAKKSF